MYARSVHPPSFSCMALDDHQTEFVGCADILELDVEHDRHLTHIVRIRYAIHSEGSWEDVSEKLSA
jgi:hypothetical protein